MIDYTRFYGFSEIPFDISPDPKFFFPSASHSEALASLRYGITHKKGFILILGEAGIGKTTLLHYLINTLDVNVKPLFFPQSLSHFEQMLQEMLTMLDLSPALKTKGSMIHELYDHLIGCLTRDETVAIIIDEAQNIGLDVIEEVRLLANLETSTAKLLQIVLVGKPELQEKLRSEVIRQIKQRIVIVCQIKPLSEKESWQYIDHRLRIAGSGAAEVYTDEALSLICRSAKGFPLALNVLCSNALSVGYCLAEKRISSSTVKKILPEKDILTSDRAQTLALRIKRRLPHKIFYSITALVFLALILFFGRSYLQPIFDAPEPNHSVLPPAVGENTSAPKIKPQAAADHISGSPDPKIMNAAQEVPKIAAAPADHSNSEIHIKEIAEVKQGVNLYSLAYRYYKVSDETFIDHILKLNPEIRNPHLILISQKIKIPEINQALLIIQYPDSVYKIHLRTFADRQGAIQFRRNAELWGKETEIVPLKVSSTETWYRVMAGPFANKDEASKALEEMKQKGFSMIPSQADKS